MTWCPQPSRGIFDGPTHRYAVKVYYEDTDAGGVVFYANYLRWFERARSDILELLGIDQRAALDAGDGYYVVSDVDIRYRAPARLGDVVIVETQCESAGMASIRMRQTAWRDDTTLCEAAIRVGFIGSDGKPRRQPDAWREALAEIVLDQER